jgi:hypothetical protein
MVKAGPSGAFRPGWRRPNKQKRQRHAPTPYNCVMPDCVTGSCTKEVVCLRCKKPGHIARLCMELRGAPANRGARPASRGQRRRRGILEKKNYDLLLQTAIRVHKLRPAAN